MKKILLFSSLILLSSNAHAEFINGYTRQSGTYVQPHFQSAPDGNPYNNYSTRGNTNPYTGQPGNVTPNRPIYPSAGDPVGRSWSGGSYRR